MAAFHLFHYLYHYLYVCVPNHTVYQVSVAHLADAAAVLNLVSVLAEDLNAWRALQPHSLDQLLSLIPSRVADWTILLGSSPCSSNSGDSDAKITAATKDAGGGHVYAVRMCADVVSKHFDGKRDEKHSLSKSDEPSQNKQQQPQAFGGNASILSPLAVPADGPTNKNKNQEGRGGDDHEEDDDDDDTWGEWFGAGEHSGAASSSFAQRLEDELINALAPAMLFVRRTSPLSPAPHSHGRPRWLVPVASSATAANRGAAAPGACVLPVGTFVHLRDGSRWCVSAAEPTYDSSGSSADVTYRLMQLAAPAAAPAAANTAAGSPGAQAETKNGGAAEGQQSSAPTPPRAQVETTPAVAETIQPSSSIAFAETSCGPLFLPRALYSFDPLASTTVSLFRAQYLQDLAAPNPPSLGHLAQLLFFAKSVLQAPASSSTNDYEVDEEAIEWRSSVVLIAEAALWALIANVNAWERTREAARYQARMNSRRSGAGGEGKDGSVAKKLRAGEDDEEMAVDALLMHVFANCGLVADNNDTRVVLPGSLLHALRSAESAMDPEGAPFFADDVKQVLLGSDTQEGASGAIRSSGRLSIADRVAAATQRQKDRDAKRGGGSGRGEVSASFDWT